MSSTQDYLNSLQAYQQAKQEVEDTKDRYMNKYNQAVEAFQNSEFRQRMLEDNLIEPVLVGLGGYGLKKTKDILFPSEKKSSQNQDEEGDEDADADVTDDLPELQEAPLESGTNLTVEGNYYGDVLRDEFGDEGSGLIDQAANRYLSVNADRLGANVLVSRSRQQQQPDEPQPEEQEVDTPEDTEADTTADTTADADADATTAEATAGETAAEEGVEATDVALAADPITAPLALVATAVLGWGVSTDWWGLGSHDTPSPPPEPFDYGQTFASYTPGA